jgi:hypothetical protein
MDYKIYFLLFINNVMIASEMVTTKSENIWEITIGSKKYTKLPVKALRNSWFFELPYSPNQLCTMQKTINDGIFYSFYDAFTGFRSMPSKLELLFPKDHIQFIQPQVCYKFSAYTFIITKHRMYNYTTIQRGSNARIIAEFKYDRLIYDHMKNKLFATHKGFLHAISPSDIDALWEKRTTELKIHKLFPLDSEIVDLIIQDGWMFTLTAKRRCSMKNIDYPQYTFNCNSTNPFIRPFILFPVPFTFFEKASIDSNSPIIFLFEIVAFGLLIVSILLIRKFFPTFREYLPLTRKNHPNNDIYLPTILRK